MGVQGRPGVTHTHTHKHIHAPHTHTHTDREQTALDMAKHGLGLRFMFYGGGRDQSAMTAQT